MAGMCAVYHGLMDFAGSPAAYGFTVKVADIARDLRYTVLNPSFFDTLSLRLPPACHRRGRPTDATQTRRINLRHVEKASSH